MVTISMMVDRIKTWRFCLLFWLVTHAAYTFCQQCDVTNVHITHTDGKEHVLNVKHVKPVDCANSKPNRPCYDVKKSYQKNSGGSRDDSSTAEGPHLFTDPDLKPVVKLVFREMSPYCNAKTPASNLPKGLCTLKQDCCTSGGQPKVSKEILESYTNQILEDGRIPFKTSNNDLNKEIVYGVVLLNSGFYSEAIEKFTALIKECQDCIAGYVGRASALARKDLYGYYKHAIEDLDKAIQLDNNNPDLYVRRAEIEAPVGLYKEALNDINEAFKLDPEISMVYLRGEINLMGGKIVFLISRLLFLMIRFH